MVASPLVSGLAVAGVVVVIAVLAELLHARRVGRVAPLAFGPHRTLFLLAIVSPVVRVLVLGAAAWALAVLVVHPPMTHKTGEIKANEYRHLILVLDVSPSMQLTDAGPGGKQSRSQRAADLIQSFFERVQAERYKTTVIAFYSDAKMVVKDTADREVIRNILTDLPMRHAFKAGESDMFSGLTMAAETAKPWAPGSTVLMVVTDGDTVPATGMPKMPVAIGNNVVMIGVGNPSVGKNIAGHSSRQDVSTMRQTAARLNGSYHDGNDKQLSTELVSRLDEKATPPNEEQLTLREVALITVAISTATLAMLPMVLTLIGTGWTPGRRPGSRTTNRGVPQTVGVG